MRAAQLEVERWKPDDMGMNIPPALALDITRLKDALSHFSDAALACAGPSVDPEKLQKQIADALHANAPEPPPNAIIPKDDRPYDEALGSYGHNLRVRLSRPAGVAGVLALRYSFNVACGADNMLLVYEPRGGGWTQALRWQAPPLKRDSDAFGDFFLTAFLPGPQASESGAAGWRVVVAHGTPWCTSRFSGFATDLLTAGSDPARPRVLWHTGRGYSRGEFAPRLTSSGDTFELRLNADCMGFDPSNCFERRVIYRYAVHDGSQTPAAVEVRRLNPLGLDARGFVEEWLSAPWMESSTFADPGAIAKLKAAYDQFQMSANSDSNQIVEHSLGPVRACAARGVLQVQIDSTLERFVPGKPGSESQPLPSTYFHVRAVPDGYQMISAPSAPDPTCTGPDLAPARRN